VVRVKRNLYNAAKSVVLSSHAFSMLQYLYQSSLHRYVFLRFVHKYSHSIDVKYSKSSSYLFLL
jgi:hypothetical protein